MNREISLGAIGIMGGGNQIHPIQQSQGYTGHGNDNNSIGQIQIAEMAREMMKIDSRPIEYQDSKQNFLIVESEDQILPQFHQSSINQSLDCYLECFQKIWMKRQQLKMAFLQIKVHSLENKISHLKNGPKSKSSAYRMSHCTQTD